MRINTTDLICQFFLDLQYLMSEYLYYFLKVKESKKKSMKR